jgi:hypothetical protein
MSGKGKTFETQSKRFLMEFFKTHLVFKLINTERMDFIAIDFGGTIHVIEAKQTKSSFYNPKSSPQKRDQLAQYFEITNELRRMPDQRFASFWLMTRLRGKVNIESYENMNEIPTRIERQK